MAGCIFCGTSPTTDAHILRKGWIDEVMPLARRYRHRRDADDSPHPKEGDWTTSAVDLKVNSVCNGCNSGWMDRLDHAAENLFLTHAVTGYAAKLASMADKGTLARWCALVASLFDQTLRPPTYPKRAREAIRDGQAPEDMQVWLYRTKPPSGRDVAWCANRHLTVIAEFQSSGVQRRHDVCFTTFCVKELVVQVAQPTADALLEERLVRRGGEAFTRRIWPAPLMPLIWPPPETLQWENALELRDNLANLIKGEM